MKINLKLFIFLLLFIVIASSTFQLDNFVVVDALLSFLSKIVFFISLLLYFVYRKNSKLLFFIAVFFLSLFVISYIRRQEYIRVIPIFMKVSSFLMICDIFCKKYNKDIISILYYILTIVIYLNFFLMIFFDGIFGYSDVGMTRYLVTSNHNQFAATLIPTILVAHIRYYYTENKISLFILHLVAVLTVLIPGSMTATVSILLWIIYFYFFRTSRFNKLVLTSMVGGILFFFVVFILLPGSNLNLGWISRFVDFIGKDMTFSARTTIWARTILEIVQKPIYGEGLFSVVWARAHIDSVNAHNIILQLLLQGGFILLGIFSLLVYYVIYKLLKFDNLEYKFLVIVSVVLFFLMSMFEVYNYNMLFIYIVILYVASFYDNKVLNDV